MKISAMPAGQGGNPGTDLQGHNLGVTASSSKIAAAKAIAQGLEPEQQEETPAEKLQSVRRIKMKTNVSPEQYLPEIQQETNVTEAPAQSDSTTTDNSGQTNAAVESTQPLSPQFAALAKQRRELQVMKQALAKEREAIEQAKSAASDDSVSKADLLANPLKIFDLGLTYDQLTEAILANQSGVSPEIKALKEELKALKEGVDNKFITQEQMQEESALAQIADDMEAIAKQGDDFELFRERKGLERALNKVYSHFKKTGQVLDTREVMLQIENQILDEAIQFASFKKVKSKIAPEPVQTPPQSQGKQMRTLTNRDSAGTPMSAKARAIAAFQGNLRK